MPIAANPDGVLDIENATLRSREIATLSNFVAGNDEIRSSGAPVVEVYGDPANVGGLLPTLELVSNTESVTGTSFTRFTSNAGVFTLQSGTDGDADSKGDIAFSSVGGDTEHMRIQGSTGNVGIGTVSPGKKLEIADGYQSLGGYIDTYNILGINGGMVLGVRQGGGTYVDGMRISGSGYVGIGTGNPLARLQVGDGLIPAVNTRDADGSISVFGTGRKKVDPGKPGIYHRESVGLGVSSDYHMSFEVNGSSSPLDAMRITNVGTVGIGTVSPYAKLTVIGTGNLNASYAARRYFRFDVNLQPDTSTWGNASIYGNDAIVSGSYIASIAGSLGGSDERIKKEIVDVEDGAALETLRLLKPKQYKYKDVINRGDEPVWGFIAQEVGATLPYATQLRTECLPNIYELANVSDSNVITFTNFDTSNLESNAMVLKVLDEDDIEHIVNITEVVDEHSVRVDEDLSEWIGTVEGSEGDKIFVYGQQVDDFVFLKKDAIWTCATAALQEVDHQLQTEKAKVITLETQLTSVLTRLDALESA
jgi:hypothetical protein